MVNILGSLPLYFSIARARFFQYFLNEIEAPRSWVIAFNFTYVALCLVLQHMPFIKSDDLMNVNGAITCFFTIYLIPIILHFQAYHGKDSLMLKMKKSISKIGRERERIHPSHVNTLQ